MGDVLGVCRFCEGATVVEGGEAEVINTSNVIEEESSIAISNTTSETTGNVNEFEGDVQPTLTRSHRRDLSWFIPE